MKKPLRLLLLSITALAVMAVLFMGLAAAPTGTNGRVVKVGVYENAPKIFHDREGRPAGLFIELLQEIARHENWTLEFVPCIWSDCLQRLNAGEIDLMPDVAFSEERNQRFDFHAIAVASSWSQIYRSANVPLKALSGLAGLRIAVLRGSIQEQFLADMMAGNQLPYVTVAVASFNEGFDAVKRGHADAVVSNNFFGGRNASQYGLKETPLVFQPATLYFVSAQGRNNDLLDRIDHYLDLWRSAADSVYFDAMKRTMVPPPAQFVPAWLRFALLGATAMMLLLLAAALLLRWQVRQRTDERDRSNRRLERVLSASPVVLYSLQRESGEFRVNWVSSNFERLFGFTPDQAAVDAWWRNHVHPEDLDKVQTGVARLQLHGHIIHEYRMFDAQGSIRHIRDEMQLTRGSAGQPEQIVGTWSDLTELREQTDKLSFLSNHDPLTNLPNRILLHARLTRSIQRAQLAGTQIAVLHIDLDRFKTINDTLGHTVGDEFLREAAMHMVQAVGTDNTLARVGGDAFVILLEHDVSVHGTTDLARRILQLSAEPLAIGGHQLVITTSIGISLYPADGDNADTLLQHAELALYDAKNQGRNTLRFFASELSAGVLERLVMENSLRGAIRRNELVLHYQPQVKLDSGGLIGVEALVRWQHPDIGLVPPGQFIPLAEELGIIGDIGAWVLHEACRQMVAWHAAGLAVPSVAVNLSVKQLDQEVLLSQVTRILHETGMDATQLELEVTESAIMREPDKAVATLAELKALGIKLAIDDFGTGHSSLAYLKRLPLDRLKIDQSFVRDIGRDTNDEAISRTVISLARSLGLETVAEGVEREEQAAFLLREGCEIGQGYFYSRPLPAGPELGAWLKARCLAGLASNTATHSPP